MTPLELTSLVTALSNLIASEIDDNNNLQLVGAIFKQTRRYLSYDCITTHNL